MALTASFSEAQPVGEPSQIVFTDTSTGTDGSVTQRRIYIAKADGSFIVESGVTTDYNAWPNFPSSTTITLDLLDKDYATRLVVEWCDVSGNVLYSVQQDAVGFTSYNEDYDYGLTQLMTANPDLVDDNGFRQHKSDLRDFIDSGDRAISRASDLYNAQRCYDLATNLRIKSQYYFNADN